MSLPLSCLLVTSVNCAKAAEPTQVSFGGGADLWAQKPRVRWGVRIPLPAPQDGAVWGRTTWASQ